MNQADQYAEDVVIASSALRRAYKLDEDHMITATVPQWLMDLLTKQGLVEKLLVESNIMVDTEEGWNTP